MLDITDTSLTRHRHVTDTSLTPALCWASQGLWLRLPSAELAWLWGPRAPPSATLLDAAPHLPNVTMVGSPNFGARSAYRDLESQCVIATANPGLRRQLDREWSALASDGSNGGVRAAVVVDDALLERPERQLRGWGWHHGRWIAPVTRLIASFL